MIQKPPGFIPTPPTPIVSFPTSFIGNPGSIFVNVYTDHLLDSTNPDERILLTDNRTTRIKTHDRLSTRTSLINMCPTTH